MKRTPAPVIARLLVIAPLASVLGLALIGLVGLSACGPTYPNCDNDKHCREKNQVCVDKLCRDCRDDSQCNKVDPCRECGDGYTCTTKPGCCKSDLDCPGGRCWKQGGAATGSCGGQCQSNDQCPAGQRCAGGSCVPDVECTGDAGCGPGEKCVRGRCQAAACEIEPIHFDFNEYAIRLDQEQLVRRNAECVKESGRRHRVEGHCDERGSDEYNLALGQRRAGAVSKQYKALGVPEGNLSTISYGEERPACNESNESCWQQNRRAETVPQ